MSSGQNLELTPLELREGDYLDLEGDEYADPNSEVDAFQYLYIEVMAKPNQETPDCVLVKTDVDWFGFPNNHALRVYRRVTA